LSPGIATAINIHVPFSLSRITISGLLFGMILSVCTCWFHSMVTLPPRLVSTDFGTCSHQCVLSNCTPLSFHMLKCSCAVTLSCLFIYCSFAIIIIIIIIIIIAIVWLVTLKNSRSVSAPIFCSAHPLCQWQLKNR
jgi:hypothetical protein